MEIEQFLLCITGGLLLDWQDNWMLGAKSSVVCRVWFLVWKLSNTKWLTIWIKCANELKVNKRSWKLFKSTTFMECSLCSRHFTTNRSLAGMDGTGVHRTRRVYTAVVMRSSFGPEELEFQFWCLLALWHWISNLILLFFFF